MKILFLTDNFPPEVNAPATRTYEHVTDWIKKGAVVTVVTGVPNFPHGQPYFGYTNSFYKKEGIAGIDVRRVWSYMAKNEGFAKRILDYISFGLSSSIAGLFIKADVIVATSPQFFTAVAGFILSKIKRRPWIFELRDLWPESIKAVGAMRNQFLLRMLERIELFLYRDADLVIALTKAFKENLVSRGISADTIVVIPNGSNLELFYPRKKDTALVRELGIQRKFVVGYLGTHGMAHGLRFIAEAAAKVKSKNIHFLFVGDGAEKKRVQAAAMEKRLRNMTFLNPVPREDVPRYLSIMDVALVNLKKDPAFTAVLPSKIFEAAAMGKPILLGVDGEARRVVEQYAAGLFFEPENETAFLAAIDRMRKDQKLYSRFEKGCAELARAFDRTVLSEKMLECLKNVVRR
ncbi:glycosyltransferase family 4 protein [Candidatus Wolfebacteria bacterium]|nr:glycosyltransferase family 4 protein [Candidatus Wolfebacteria bacterium]